MHSTYEQVGLKGPPTGVSMLEWSFDSKFLATKCETSPNAVYVWDMTKIQLAAVLIHKDSVKTFKFSPNSMQLLIGTGQSRVFIWSPKGASVVDLPRNEFAAQGPSQVCVQRIAWNPDGTNLVLSGGPVAILGFL